MRLMPTPRAMRRSQKTARRRYLRVPVHIYLLPLPRESAATLMNVLKAATATGEVPSGLTGLDRDIAGIGAAVHARGLHKCLDLDLPGARIARDKTDSALCVVFADNRDEPAVYVTDYNAGSFSPLLLGYATTVSTKYNDVPFPPLFYYDTRDPWSRDGFTEMSMSISGTSTHDYDATTPTDSPFYDFQFYGAIGGYASPPADVPGAQLIPYDEFCKIDGISDGGVENHPVLHTHCVLNVREHGWYLPGSHVWKRALEFPF